jgi:AcrR family transcriptional regulator
MVKRPYRSPLRASQAEATRARILEAGLTLFATRGYPGTSVTAIARAAGVSPETIYASVGSKRGIIDALLAEVDTMGIAEQAQAEVARRGGGPGVGLDVLTELATRFWVTYGRLAGVLRNGVGDPDIGEAWLTRQAERRSVIGGLIASWPPGTRRAELTVDEAADIAWASTSGEQFSLLVEVRGWPTERFAAWTAGALRRELLASDH